MNRDLKNVLSKPKFVFIRFVLAGFYCMFDCQFSHKMVIIFIWPGSLMVCLRRLLITQRQTDTNFKSAQNQSLQWLFSAPSRSQCLHKEIIPIYERNQINRTILFCLTNNFFTILPTTILIQIIIITITNGYISLKIVTL